MSKSIGQVKCTACDFPRASVNEGKNGTLSVHCCECGTQTMIKSPKAVESMRKRLGQTSSAAVDHFAIEKL